MNPLNRHQRVGRSLRLVEKQTLSESIRVHVYPVKAHPNDNQSAIAIIANKIKNKKIDNICETAQLNGSH